MSKQQLIGFNAEIKHKDNGEVTKNFRIGIFRDRFDTDDVYMITRKEEIGVLMDPNNEETFTVIKAEPILEDLNEKRQPMLIINCGMRGYSGRQDDSVLIKSAKEWYGKHLGYTEAMEIAFVNGAKSEASKLYHFDSIIKELEKQNINTDDLFVLRQKFLKWHSEVFRSTHDVFEWFLTNLKTYFKQNNISGNTDSDYRIELHE